MSVLTSQEILESVRQQLRRVLDDDQIPAEIHLDSNLSDDLGLGSLEAVSLVMNLEDELDVMLTDDEVSGLRQVRDVVLAIENKLVERSSSSSDESETEP